jgi:hypothetical protein
VLGSAQFLSAHLLWSDAMEPAQAFIFDAGWIFFAAWGVVLAVVSVIAFGRDVLEVKQRETGKNNQTTKVHKGNLGELNLCEPEWP